MGTAARKNDCMQSLTGFSLAADFAGVPGRSPGSCFSGRSAFPSPKGTVAFRSTQRNYSGGAALVSHQTSLLVKRHQERR